MSSIGAAPRAAVSLSPARAEASRINGAKSKGPKTAEGKERSSQNALKHGLRAQKHLVLPGESATEFAALEAALLEELAPEGALQAVLARRIVAAAWRLERAERLEGELFARNLLGGGGRNLGLALIRDCNSGARSFDTLLRYRSGTLAEFWRALRTLKALQAEAGASAMPQVDEARANPGETATAPGLHEREIQRRDADAVELPAIRPGSARDGAPQPPRPRNPNAHLRRNPIEPEAPRNPGEIGPAPRASRLRPR